MIATVSGRLFALELVATLCCMTQLTAVTIVPHPWHVSAMKSMWAVAGITRTFLSICVMGDLTSYDVITTTYPRYL